MVACEGEAHGWEGGVRVNFLALVFRDLSYRTLFKVFLKSAKI